jgi:biotin-dependent carboxylase-like uncharacterized protein
MSALLISASTPLCQLQDGGRFGVRHLGISQGGALDWLSMAWANRLLGNRTAAAVIEVALGGFAVQAQQDCCLALTGADLAAQIDGQPLKPWRSFMLRQGQELRLNQPLLGARAYLAAPGGFNATQVLGSCATVLREGLGGLDGRGSALAQGDVLSYSGAAVALAEVAKALRPDVASTAPLELILGAQIGDFSGQSLFALFNQPWQIDSRADRMGVRLLGSALHYQGPQMISEGIPLGAIQVPPDGQPIVLLNDRQTIGGYPRVGALTPLAVARLAQCLPGTALRFSPVLQDWAWQQHRELLQRLQG